MYKAYQVSSGDTWESISNKFHTSASNLQALNGIAMLVPGSTVVVPRVIEEDYFTVYTVKKGDNLYDIARKNGTSVDILLNANGLEKDDYLYPGQELLIPKEGIMMYVVKDGETLQNVASKLGTTQNSVIQDNENIYLLPDQLLVFKK